MLSVMRTFVFQVLLVLTMPLLWELDGIWAANTAAEGLACVLVFSYLIAKRKKYHY